MSSFSTTRLNIVSGVHITGRMLKVFKSRYHGSKTGRPIYGMPIIEADIWKKRADDMRRMILLIPVMLGTLAVTASAQATPEVDLAGLYICDGVSPDGRPYQAIVEIVKHHDTYELQWLFESEVVGIGLGIRSGNVLAVMHYTGLPGVIAYRIEQGPRLVGEWTVAGADGALFSETLTKAPAEIGAPASPEPRTPEPQERQQRHRQPREAVVARSRM